MIARRILLAYPDPASRMLIGSMLMPLGLSVDEAENDRAAVRILEAGMTDVVIAGVDPIDPDALELLSYVRRKQPRVPVILLFVAPHPERAKEALKRGASTVLRFPIPATQLRAAVAQALGVAESELLAKRQPSDAFHPKPSETYSVHESNEQINYELIIEIDAPEDATDDEMVALAVEAAMRADQLHRDLGGHGLTVDRMEIEQGVITLAGVPRG